MTKPQGTATRHIGKEVFTHAISLRRQLPSEAPSIGHLLDNLPARDDLKKEAITCANLRYGAGQPFTERQ
jgi:hypothetical protein